MRLLIEKNGAKLEYEDGLDDEPSDYIKSLIVEIFGNFAQVKNTKKSTASTASSAVEYVADIPEQKASHANTTVNKPIPEGYKVRFFDGLRYIVDGSGNKAHSPDAKEPLIIDGSAFTGRINKEGKYIWSKAAKRDNEEISNDEIEELKKLASGETHSEHVEVFDESSAFDDLENLNDDACEISSDNLTVTVVFKGAKYAKTFKTEAVAIRQRDAITEYINSDPITLEQLLTGNATQYRRV